MHVGIDGEVYAFRLVWPADINDVDRPAIDDDVCLGAVPFICRAHEMT